MISLQHAGAEQLALHIKIGFHNRLSFKVTALGSAGVPQWSLP